MKIVIFFLSFLNKVHDAAPLDHIDSSWLSLKEAVIAIQESRKLSENLTQEDLYRCVDNLITARSPSQLYADLRGNH